MNTKGKPIVFISYSWFVEKDKEGNPVMTKNGKRVRIPDEKAFKLAELLRESGFDSRLDLYFKDNKYEFVPPVRRSGDGQDPWIVWAEEQIRDADCVLLLCTPEYTASESDPLKQYPMDWSTWHQIADNSMVVPFASLWWDWHFIAKEVEARPEKFIPIGFGPYGSELIPAFVIGATYCNLDSTKDFDGLLRRIKTEYRRRHPRNGVFVSYAHRDEQEWLDSFLAHLAFLKRQGVEIWTDREIKPGARFHEEIQSSLAKAQVAVLLVTPAYLESEYIASHELPNLLQAAESEGLVIFWIPVKPSSYNQCEIAQFQAAHPPSEPLSGLRGSRRDQAFVSIASKLADALSVNKTNAP